MIAKSFQKDDNEKVFISVFVACLLFALVFEIYPITFIYGIVVSFASVFLWVLFRLYGVGVTIASSIILQISAIFLSNHSYFDIIIVLEILAVAWLLKRFPNMPFVLSDVIFWLAAGGPLLFFIFQFLDIDSSMALFQ
ncbi:MAG: hypothetical protein ACRC5C_11575, partial [Bacilli bacterium]